ncbi:MAG: transcription termination/antitermination protein NusA [Planctomycetes bacterium]|nr:transcription termination/antitermination protein NusA [Planctomycetota bacterium]
MDVESGIGQSELLQVADAVAREKGIDRDTVLEAMEQAISHAGKRKYGQEHDIRATIDRTNGTIEMMRFIEVAAEIEDPVTQVTLDEAQARKPDAEIGEFLTEPLPPIDFGRIAAQTAKQVIVQRVREAERERQFGEYKDRVGEIVNGLVKRVEYGNVMADLGRAEALLRREEMLPRESFHQGDRVRAYVLDVREEPHQVRIVLTQTHPDYIRKLFELEVPEVHERIIEVDAKHGHAARSVRQYEAAEAAITIKTNLIKQTLPTHHRRIAVANGEGGVTMICPGDNLSGEELDLIDVIGNSLLLDRLLPNRRVRVDENWSPPAAALAALLGLEAASRSDVKCRLTEVKGDVASVEMSGTVTGAVGGVSSEITLNARFTYHLTQQRITGLALAMREDRSIGHASPGLNVTAKLQMAIGSPRQVGKLSEQLRRQLGDRALARLNLKADVRNTRLRYTALGKYTLLHDPRWHIVAEQPGLCVLRLVDRGELIAQCKIATRSGATPSRNEPGEPVTIDSFRAQVQKALGGNLQRIDGVSQTKTPAGYRVIRIFASGIVSELPIQWRYLHVSDTKGHQATFVFTLESSLVERFSTADLALLSALRFTAPRVAKQPEAGPAEAKARRK